VFVFFHWKVLLVGAVIAFSSGALGVMCRDDLPCGEFYSPMLILIPLSLCALWKRNEASHLHEQLRTLEEDLREEELEYEYSNGDVVKN